MKMKMLKLGKVIRKQKYVEDCVCNCPRVSTARLCYTATGNSPGHDIKRHKYFFSIKSIVSWSIDSCHHSNDEGCSGIEGLANRIN